MVWKPHVTVAAVIENDKRFLLVEEKISGRICYNQPAGHLEENETLAEAIVREVLEETAHSFVPTGVIGIYHWKNELSSTTFVRFVFSGKTVNYDPGRVLDKEIIATHWFSSAEIEKLGSQLRSPLVGQAFADWQAGKCYPLEILTCLH